MFLVFQIILQNHVIILSVDFIDKGHPKEINILPNFVAIDFVVMEI